MLQFEAFIDKMETLQHTDNKWRRLMEHKRNDAAFGCMSMNDPRRQVTQNYYRGTINGFNDENIVKSLEDIGLVLRATGYHGNALNDYN